ncbi:MAG: hypothetical protein Q7P63_01080 [Verrucomicrobiota bacterium JB022]|nr:hypothetical protein [Verrucomicrobiota bacterium JB022]
MSANFDEPTDQPILANIAADEVSSNQQRHYPYLAGTQPIALSWVGQVYDQRTVPVKQDSGGKK